MQSKGNLFLLLVIALTAVSGYLYKVKPYQFGLDVEGGMRLTYRMKTEELKPEQQKNLDQIRSNMTTILRERVSSGLGVVEGSVQAKGDNEFIVELPGFTNAEKAREMMSSTASIKCYWAKTVQTARASYRKYIRGGEEMVGGAPVVYFQERSGSKQIKPGDPSYLEMLKSWDLVLEGGDLAKAFAEVQGTRTVPNFAFSSSGASKLEAFTRQHMNQGENIAFVLDNKVLSIAPIKDGTILSDNAFIDGQFSPEYVNGLVRLLNAGALPVSLEETSNQSVDPTIGRYAKDQMVRGGLISFAVIAVALIAYYALPGFVALLALVLYVLFSLTLLKWINATFSLAAMAGFILSVGMAVDANILVFERSKEEMRDGRSLLTAVELGFKRALPAIIDSNACTILSCLVLMNLGTGPVRGFATTLIIGVLVSLFTAVTVTRSLLVFLMENKIVNDPKAFALGRQWFGNKHLHVVEKSGKWFLISLLTVVIGIPFMAMGGLKQNVEFAGGIAATYELPDANMTAGSIASNLEKAGILGSNVKVATVSGVKYADLTIPSDGPIKPGDPEAYTKIAQAAGNLKQSTNPTITSIGPTIQAETKTNAILAVVVSSALIVIYLGFRFGSTVGGIKNGIKFGVAAIGALVHDVFVMLALAAIVGYFKHWEVSALFITSVLTVIGFSVHDTIVIFDRLRENLRKPQPEEDFAHLCNRSITQSFARSINTSMTVMVTLLLLVAFGTATDDLKFFCLSMFFGILSGTYSSIYNATPILYIWDRMIVKRRGPEHSLIAEATAELNRLRAAAMSVQQPGMGMAPASAPGPSAAAQRGYGTVKRKDSVVDRATKPVDEEE